jgi:tetratricopeptide (TPR) repeat protein
LPTVPALKFPADRASAAPRIDSRRPPSIGLARAALLLGAIALSACDDRPGHAPLLPSDARWFREGDEALARIDRGGEDEDFLRVGVVCLALGQTARAKEHTSQALALDPSSPENWLWHAHACLAHGDFGSAYVAYRRAALAGPAIVPIVNIVRALERSRARIGEIVQHGVQRPGLAGVIEAAVPELREKLVAALAEFERAGAGHPIRLREVDRVLLDDLARRPSRIAEFAESAGRTPSAAGRRSLLDLVLEYLIETGASLWIDGIDGDAPSIHDGLTRQEGVAEPPGRVDERSMDSADLAARATAWSEPWLEAESAMRVGERLASGRIDAALLDVDDALAAGGSTARVHRIRVSSGRVAIAILEADQIIVLERLSADRAVR